eukprot:1185506-Prorocentrum_minimum.AAC.5
MNRIRRRVSSIEDVGMFPTLSGAPPNQRRSFGTLSGIVPISRRWRRAPLPRPYMALQAASLGEEEARSLRRLGLTDSQPRPWRLAFCARRHKSGGGLNLTADAAACQWLRNNPRFLRWIHNSPTNPLADQDIKIVIGVLAGALLTGMAILLVILLVRLAPPHPGCAAA